MFREGPEQGWDSSKVNDGSTIDVVSHLASWPLQAAILSVGHSELASQSSIKAAPMLSMPLSELRLFNNCSLSHQLIALARLSLLFALPPIPVPRSIIAPAIVSSLKIPSDA
jgi:hypothetical protein